ncbi:DUF1367 family protein [Marinicellulosiphila megalodicopiae]|uniref:DUF1367 family protein n=1 Tax=Marinicellulosiphila megalodicopiae TaxID=2724896 RepID=UPI003BAF767F
MTIEIMMIKQSDGTFRPCTTFDIEKASRIKAHSSMKFVGTRQKARTLKKHQKYWSGLIDLTFDYWEPMDGLLNASEVVTIKKFETYINSKNEQDSWVTNECHEFLKKLRASRESKIEEPQKTKKMLHEWIKLEAGWYELHVTPKGIRKVPKSINFNAISEEEFTEFYKAAFSVCWKYILNHKFENQAEADNAINTMLVNL